jgi:hypothetical protein
LRRYGKPEPASNISRILQAFRWIVTLRLTNADMAERAGATVTGIAGSHAVYVSQPNAVAALIGAICRIRAGRTPADHPLIT